VETFINTLNIILPTLYALAWADYALLFFRNDNFAEKTAPWLLYLTGILHGLDLLLRGLHFRHYPVATVFEAFSLLAFSVLVVYILIEWRTGVRTTGFFIVAFVFIFQLVSSAFITPPPTDINPLLADPSFVLHASTAVLGYSGMAISAVYGLLYLMLFYDIKKSRFGIIYKQLPSLEVMANFTYRAATLGFIFLSVGSRSGFDGQQGPGARGRKLDMGSQADDYLPGMAHLRVVRRRTEVLGMVAEKSRLRFFGRFRGHLVLPGGGESALHFLSRIRLKWIYSSLA
jgi:ABC-type uncharacterized transport system permease subunit